MRKPLFGGTKHWLLVVLGLLLGSILLTACGENSPSVLNTFGPVAASESFLFYVILVIATIIFVLVEGALIFSIIRYRERPGMPNPRQIHGNLRIEVLWTVIPSIILFIVLFFTIQGLVSVATQPAGPTLNVEVVGHQWWWEFYYPQYHITTADELHAPVNKIVHVDLYSNNVIHSFWIPALTGKTDDIPGHDNQKWFKADKTGTYLGECTEFCGAQHAHMAFNAVIESSDNFNTWVSTQQQAALSPAANSMAAKGKQIFAGQCTACHGIVGVNLKGDDDPRVKCDNSTTPCLVGPNLTHFGARSLIAGGILTNNKDQCSPGPDLQQRCHLAQWLHDPQGIKPGNDMMVSLTNDQVNALVVYLESLK